MSFVNSVLNSQQQPPVVETPPAAQTQTQAPAPAPSFRDAVAASQAARDQHLNELASSVGAAPIATETPAPPAPVQPGVSAAQQQALDTAIKEMSADEFDTWVKAQPPGAIKKAAENIAAYYSTQMREQFGELLGLGDLAQADPKVRKKLERIVKDPAARDFILEKAFAIFDPQEFGTQSPAPGAAPAAAALTQDDVARTVEQTIAQRDAKIRYEAERSREVEALVRENPALNWQQHGQKAALKVEHIINIAEQRTAKSGQRVSYRDVASELDLVNSAVPPQPVPQTSTTQTPPAPQVQAPQTAIESKQRMVAQLNQHGGLLGLAAALPARR